MSGKVVVDGGIWVRRYDEVRYGLQCGARKGDSGCAYMHMFIDASPFYMLWFVRFSDFNYIFSII